MFLAVHLLTIDKRILVCVTITILILCTVEVLGNPLEDRLLGPVAMLNLR